MAVYVLLAFDDDDEAKIFVKSQLKYLEMIEKEELSPYDIPEFVPAKVRSVYKKPVQFCNCDRTSGWTRGKRFGWWVCADCGKPGEAWAKGFAWYTALGTNLLPREICGEPPQPAGWDSPDAWTFLIKKTDPELDQNSTAAELEPHKYVGRLDRTCEVPNCNKPDRDSIHIWDDAFNVSVAL